MLSSWFVLSFCLEAALRHHSAVYSSLFIIKCVRLYCIDSPFITSDPFIHTSKFLYFFSFCSACCLSFLLPSILLMSSFCPFFACRIEMFDTVELCAIIIRSRNTIVKHKRSSIWDGNQCFPNSQQHRRCHGHIAWNNWDSERRKRHRRRRQSQSFALQQLHLFSDADFEI